MASEKETRPVGYIDKAKKRRGIAAVINGVIVAVFAYVPKNALSRAAAEKAARERLKKN